MGEALLPKSNKAKEYTSGPMPFWSSFLHQRLSFSQRVSRCPGRHILLGRMAREKPRCVGSCDWLLEPGESTWLIRALSSFVNQHVLLSLRPRLLAILSLPHSRQKGEQCLGGLQGPGDTSSDAGGLY